MLPTRITPTKLTAAYIQLFHVSNLLDTDYKYYIGLHYLWDKITLAGQKIADIVKSGYLLPLTTANNTFENTEAWLLLVASLKSLWRKNKAVKKERSLWWITNLERVSLHTKLKPAAALEDTESILFAQVNIQNHVIHA